MHSSGQWISTFKSDIYQGELCNSIEDMCFWYSTFQKFQYVFIFSYISGLEVPWELT